jgi:hypothetical protein
VSVIDYTLAEMRGAQDTPSCCESTQLRTHQSTTAAPKRKQEKAEGRTTEISMTVGETQRILAQGFLWGRSSPFSLLLFVS